jgi:putative salt-induced outer membrane protein YdiY
MKDVSTFTTTDPKQIRLQDKTLVREKVSSNTATTAPATQPAQIVVGEKQIAPTDIKKIIPPSKWTGSVLANLNISRGNTHSEDYGVAADAQLRRDDELHDDRFSLGGAYNFGKQTVGGVQTTSADNWFAQGKYDRFFNEKWYGYGLVRVDHDRLAALNYRVAPGVGVGYQWVESADFNFSTEAGVSYVYEDYINDGSDDRVALRLAYHVDKNLSDKVSVFHNLEWLPAFNDPSDYNLNADVGIRSKLSKSWFTELKVQWQRDSTPAPGALENDVRTILGFGWTF